MSRFAYTPDGTHYADVGSGGTIATRYVSGVTGPDTWLARVSSGGSSTSAWLLSDAQGSVTSVVGLTGGVEDAITYDSFGNITSETNPSARGDMGFQGGRYDTVTGNWMFGVRQYDPTRRDWTTQDPMGFAAGDSNLQRFVGNGPTNGTDPSGMAEPGQIEATANSAAAQDAYLAKLTGADPNDHFRYWVTDPQTGYKAVKSDWKYGIPGFGAPQSGKNPTNWNSAKYKTAERIAQEQWDESVRQEALAQQQLQQQQAVQMGAAAAQKLVEGWTKAPPEVSRLKMASYALDAMAYLVEKKIDGVTGLLGQYDVGPKIVLEGAKVVVTAPLKAQAAGLDVASSVFQGDMPTAAKKTGAFVLGVGSASSPVELLIVVDTIKDKIGYPRTPYDIRGETVRDFLVQEGNRLDPLMTNRGIAAAPFVETVLTAPIPLERLLGIGGKTGELVGTRSMFSSVAEGRAFERSAFAGRRLTGGQLVDLQIELEKLYQSRGMTFEGIFAGKRDSQFLPTRDATGRITGGRIELAGSASDQPLIRIVDEASHATDVAQAWWAPRESRLLDLGRAGGRDRLQSFSHYQLFRRAASRFETSDPIMVVILQDGDADLLRRLAAEIRK